MGWQFLWVAFHILLSYLHALSPALLLPLKRLALRSSFFSFFSERRDCLAKLLKRLYFLNNFPSFERNFLIIRRKAWHDTKETIAIGEGDGDNNLFLVSVRRSPAQRRIAKEARRRGSLSSLLWLWLYSTKVLGSRAFAQNLSLIPLTALFFWN